MTAFWFFASSLAAITFGLLCAFALIISRRHRDNQGNIVSQRITAVTLLSISTYVLFVLLIGFWVFGVPISVIVARGFGDERIAWLLLGTLVDTAIRLYAFFEPEA
jgi:hypothetical protein